MTYEALAKLYFDTRNWPAFDVVHAAAERIAAHDNAAERYGIGVALLEARRRALTGTPADSAELFERCMSRAERQPVGTQLMVVRGFFDSAMQLLGMGRKAAVTELASELMRTADSKLASVSRDVVEACSQGDMQAILMSIDGLMVSYLRSQDRRPH
jgi:hypothetical protein